MSRTTTCAFGEYAGAGSILRRYMGVDGFVPFAGRIQHGWSPRRGGMPDDAISAAGPIYFWSRRAEAEWGADRSSYVGRATSIGAPFLYGGFQAGGPGESLIYFPIHGIVDRPIDPAGWRSAIRAIEHTAARAGAARVTVCLYDLDYREGFARRILESAGFVCKTAGSPWDGLAFVQRLVALIEDRAVVAASRPCTALFYALALGRPCMIVPDGLRHVADDEWTAITADPAWGRARFPALYDGPVADLYWRDELGADLVMPPDRLFETLYVDREVVACP